MSCSKVISKNTSWKREPAYFQSLVLRDWKFFWHHQNRCTFGSKVSECLPGLYRSSNLVLQNSAKFLEKFHYRSPFFITLHSCIQLHWKRTLMQVFYVILLEFFKRFTVGLGGLWISAYFSSFSGKLNC